MAYRRLADMPWLGRALGGRGEPFETPFAGGVAGGIEGREALRRWRVFIGNFVLIEACVNAARQRGDFCKRQTCTSSTREQGNRRLADDTQQRALESKFCKTHWTNRQSRQIRCRRCFYGRNRQLGSRLCLGEELP
jgi:hypothetical protein